MLFVRWSSNKYAENMLKSDSDINSAWTKTSLKGAAKKLDKTHLHFKKRFFFMQNNFSCLCTVWFQLLSSVLSTIFKIHSFQPGRVFVTNSTY